MEKQNYSEETKRKILLVAAEILAMHGEIAGNRVCQDWSGDPDNSPDNHFDRLEKISLHYNYEIENSNLQEFDRSYCSLGDEMTASFVLATALEDIAAEMSKAKD